MKKLIGRLFAALLCLTLTLCFLPGKAHAAANEKLFFNVSAIYLKGNSVTIEAGTKSGYTKLKVDGEYVDFSQCKLSNGTLHYTLGNDNYEADLSNVSIYGGQSWSITASPTITMTGGSIFDIYGGGLDGNTLTGNVTINISGGTIMNVFAGGYGADLDGNVTICMSGGTVKQRIHIGGGGTDARVLGNVQLVIIGGNHSNVGGHGNDKVTGTASAYDYGTGRQVGWYDAKFDNMVVRNGSTWYTKGDTAFALAGNTLNIASGQSLTVDSGETLTGTVVNNGTITNNGTISAALTNKSTIHNPSGSTISGGTNTGTIYNYGTVSNVTNSGKIIKKVTASGTGVTINDSVWQNNATNHDDDYTATLTANAGYKLPDTITVKVGNTTLAASDYTYNKSTGALTIPTGKITQAATVSATGLVDLASATNTVSVDADSYTYTGSEIKPGVKVNETKLDTKYYDVVEYKNNVNAGQGSVTITGKNGYTGTKTLSFTINRADIANATVTLGDSLTYNGQTQTQTISSVTFNGKTLTAGTDYTVSGDTVMNKGTYTLTVTGTGNNFEGTKEVQFSVAATSIAGKVTINLGEGLTYNGKNQTQSVASVVHNTFSTLEPGVHYEVTGNTGKDVKDYTLTVKGIGNFTGTATATFQIAPYEVTAADLEFADAIITKVYDGFTNCTAKVQIKANTFANADPITVEGTAAYNDKDVLSANKVTFTPNAVTSGNYTIAANLSISKEAAITQRPVKVTGIRVGERPYNGGTDVTIDYSEMRLDGLVDSENLKVEAVGTLTQKNVGTHDVALALTLKDDAGKASNYTLSADSQSSAKITIAPRQWTVSDIVIADKQYNGKNDAVIAEATLTNTVTGEAVELDMENSTAVFASVGTGENIEVSCTFKVKGEAEVLKNYAATYTVTTSADIYNTFDPQQGGEYTVNSNDWMNTEFVVTAAEGYSLSLTNTADGVWQDSLTADTEALDENGHTLSFYVKNAAGEISNRVDEVYKIDTVDPTGKVIMNERNWDSFIAAIFSFLTNQDQQVTIESADALSGVKTVEYYESAEALDLEGVKAVTAWTEGKSVSITAQNAKKFVYYARITDNAGNVTYLSSDGTVFDTVAPEVTGVEDGGVYYISTQITITDKNAFTVTCNGQTVTNPYILPGNTEQEYVIVATDEVGNETTVTVTMKPLTALEEPVKDMTAQNVTLSDLDTVEALLETMESMDTTNATEEELETLESIRQKGEALQEQLEALETALTTEDIEDTIQITKDNVKLEEKEALEQAKKDLEKAAEDFASNLTDGLDEEIQKQLERIEEALKAIENAETVQSAIDALPATAKPDDETAIAATEAALQAYEALTEQEKTMVKPDKLNTLLDTLSIYKIIAGDGSVWTGEGDLTMTANGAYSKFVGIQVDGKAVEAGSYEAASGSTVVKLKEKYLKTLSEGKHTLTVCYPDGKAVGTFTVDIPTASPDTGDDSKVLLWLGTFLISGMAVVCLTVSGKKRKV